MHFDIRDGGERTLRTSRKIAGAVAITDRTTGAVIDPTLYVVQAQSVRRTAGVWGAGRQRWAIDYDVADDEADNDAG